MAERGFAIQQPEPANIIALFPNAPVPIWTKRHQETNKSTERRALQYDPLFDVLAYRQLFDEKPNLTSEEFQRKLDQLDQRTEHNLVTILGERFNLEVSITRYKMVDGKLVNDDHDEAMENIIIRGQQYRLKHGNPQDRPRELAEVIGFRKRQEGLNRGVKTLISISPRGEDGSDYKHHFFDVDEAQPDGTYLMYRYTFKIPHEQIMDAVYRLNPNFPKLKPGQPLDAFLLENPISNVPLEKILAVLHQDEKAMKADEFESKVKTPTTALRQHYIKRLHENASPEEVKSNYKSILKMADISTGLDVYTADNKEALQNMSQLISERGTAAAAQELAKGKLRNVPTNCGLQEGEGAEPWSVGEFGLFRDGLGTMWISCESCHAHYIRTAGVLEPRCRYCGGTDGIACEQPQENSPQELAKAA